MSKISVKRHCIRGVKRWVVVWREGPKRKRAAFSSEAAARAESERLKTQVANTGQVWLSLSAKDRNDVIQWWHEARQKGLDVSRLIAEAETPKILSPKLSDVITELVGTKKKAGRDEGYADSLQLVLEQFAKGRESLPIDGVTLRDVEGFLDSKTLASRSTFRARLSGLFRYAMRRQYITTNPCAFLEPITYTKPNPAVFTVEQVRACLEFLSQPPRVEVKEGVRKRDGQRFRLEVKIDNRYALPWFVLSTFCGLRPEEAEKTTPADIHIREGWIKIEAQTTKVRQRRVVYPLPHAVRLLASVLDLGGLPLSPHSRRNVIRRLKSLLRFKVWPKDITRHTAASNWIGSGAPDSDVATALGNSVEVLNRDYKALVTKKEARKFWDLCSEFTIKPRKQHENRRGADTE